MAHHEYLSYRITVTDVGRGHGSRACARRKGAEPLWGPVVGLRFDTAAADSVVRSIEQRFGMRPYSLISHPAPGARRVYLVRRAPGADR